VAVSQFFFEQGVPETPVAKRAPELVTGLGSDRLELAAHVVGREMKEFVLMKRPEGDLQGRAGIGLEPSEDVLSKVDEARHGDVDAPLKACSVEGDIPSEHIYALDFDALADQFARGAADRLDESITVDLGSELEEFLE
jgi:hypothetical protein